MRKLGYLLSTAIFLGVSYSNAQSTDFDGLTFDFITPNKLIFVLNPPAQFPNPRIRAVVELNCPSGRISSGQADFDRYLKAHPKASFKSGIFTLDGFSLGCENGGIFAKSPNLETTLSALDGINISRDPNYFGIRIRIYDGYKYPNIKEGFYYDDLSVAINPENLFVEELQSETPSISPISTVGFQQGKGFTPLLYEGTYTAGRFDPNIPVTIAYNASELAFLKGWYGITIRYNLGKLSWRKLDAPPK